MKKVKKYSTPPHFNGMCVKLYILYINKPYLMLLAVVDEVPVTAERAGGAPICYIYLGTKYPSTRATLLVCMYYIPSHARPYACMDAHRNSIIILLRPKQLQNCETFSHSEQSLQLEQQQQHRVHVALAAATAAAIRKDLSRRAMKAGKKFSFACFFLFFSFFFFCMPSCSSSSSFSFPIPFQRQCDAIRS